MPLDRLTAAAQAVLHLAEQEAACLGNDAIGSEHLLLGLIAEPDGPAGWALAEIGWSPERSRAAIIAFTQRRAGPSAGARGLTPDAQRAIEQAVAEANRLQHHFVGSEHLLLGLLSDGLTAAEAIAAMGIVPSTLRASVERRMWEGV